MRRLAIAFVIAFGSVLVAQHSIAADVPERGKVGPNRDAAIEAPGKVPKKEDPLADVTLCKRAARGTAGPERARLMTDCIRRN